MRLRRAAILWGHRTKALVASVVLAIGRRRQVVIPVGNFQAQIMRIQERLEAGGIEWRDWTKGFGHVEKVLVDAETSA